MAGKNGVARKSAKKLVKRARAKAVKPVRARVEDWTPEKAYKALDKTLDQKDLFRNRRLSQDTIAGYTRDILQNRWRTNGETVKISEDGIVVDGQHRLWAVIEAGVTVPMLTARGVPLEDYDTIDIGKKRTVGDVFDQVREKDSNVLAAALNLLFRYDERLMRSASGRLKLSAPAARELLDKQPKIRDSLRISSGARNSGIGLPSPMVFAHYAMVRWAGREKADAFFESLFTGANLAMTSPILALNKKLIQARALRGGRDTIECLAWTFKAMRLYLEGGRCASGPKSLQWRKAGENPEEFPYLEQRARRKSKTPTVAQPLFEAKAKRPAKLVKLLKKAKDRK